MPIQLIRTQVRTIPRKMRIIQVTWIKYFKEISSQRVLSVDLVEDVLVNIFDFLDEKDLIRCEDVCLQWRQIIQTRYIWPRLFRRTVFHRNIHSIALSFIVHLRRWEASANGTDTSRPKVAIQFNSRHFVKRNSRKRRYSMIFKKIKLKLIKIWIVLDNGQQLENRDIPGDRSHSSLWYRSNRFCNEGWLCGDHHAAREVVASSS